MNNRLFNVNMLDHPTNRNMTVYFFLKEDHSNYFKELLQQHHLAYEFQVDHSEMKYYFGIERRYQTEARRLNYLVFAKYRRPMIPHKGARYALVIITGAIIAMAVVGAIIS